MKRFIFLPGACHSFGATSLMMSHGAGPDDGSDSCCREGGGPGPDFRKNSASRTNRLVQMAERHWWVRVLLHLAVIVRYRRNVHWHLNCIRREFHELFHSW